MNIAVSKQEAISRLTANRNKFHTQYLAKVKEYQDDMRQYAMAFVEWVEAGSVKEERPKEPLRPLDKTVQYDNLIKKLSVIVTSVVELEEYEYRQIYEDSISESHFSAGTITSGQISIC